MNDNMEKLLRRLRLKRIAVWMYEDRSVFSYIMDTYGDYIWREKVRGCKPLFRDEIDSIVGSDIRRAHNVAAQQEPAEAIDSIDPWEECSRKPAAHIFFGENKCFCQEEKKPTPKEIAKYVQMLHRRNRGDAEAVVYDALLSFPKGDVVTAFIELLKRVNPRVQQEIINGMFGQVGLPQKGEVDIEVVKREKNQTNRNLYDYYICFKQKKTGNSREVFFSNHDSATIYMMYLIDRVMRKEDCGRIDVTKNGNLLGRVHSTLFPYDVKVMGMEVKRLLAGERWSSSVKNRLSQFYTDIKNNVDSQIKGWDYSFFYYPDEMFGLRLSPENIKLPEEFCFDEWTILG